MKFVNLKQKTFFVKIHQIQHIMLISFTVENYRPFKEKKTFSLKASSLQEHITFVRENNGVKLLPAVAIYGANSSGKSNLLSALKIMKNVLLSSIKINPTETLKTDTFKLDERYFQKPTLFEVAFIKNDCTYRYGFKYSPKRINGEWLYTIKNNREKLLFVRNNDGIGVTKDFSEGIGKEDFTAENRLFLSLVAQFNGKTSLSVMNWFEELKIFSGIEDFEFETKARFNLFAGDAKAETIKRFINAMDLGIAGIQRGDVSFKKFINMPGLIIDTLSKGGTIVVDELETKLHPQLTQKIIAIFNSPESNPNRAQLIFATHDTNLLSNKIFRRDQIWFAEKNCEDESTDIYPLSEIKEQNGETIRNDRNYEKDYINGKYGT